MNCIVSTTIGDEMRTLMACLLSCTLSVGMHAQQIPPKQGTGTPVMPHPPDNQTITQPLLSPANQTTLSINSLNKILNPLGFPGADLGAQIDAALNTCHHGLSSAETIGCTVRIPTGAYTYSTTITMQKGDSLEGSGPANTQIHYTGTGDAISWSHPVFDGFTWAGSISNLTVLGSSAAANCIHVAGIGAPDIHDVTVGSCGGRNADGILFEDTHSDKPNWMERIHMHGVILGPAGKDNFTDLEFRNNGGTGSFDYSDISAIVNVHCGGKGILIGPGTDLFQVQLNVQGNINGPCGASENRTEALSVQGNLHYSRGFVGLEGSASANAIHIYSTGKVTFNGTIHSWTNGVNIPPVVDPGGFYQANPYMDFGYGGAADDGLGNFTPVVQRAAKSIDADGAVIIASSPDLTGLIDIYWDSSNARYQDVLLSVSCTFASRRPCNVTTLSNQSLTSPPVISNIRIMGGGAGNLSIPHLVVDIGNRKVLPHTLRVAAWNASNINLFPKDAAGPKVISNEGLSVNSANTSGSNGVSWGGPISGSGGHTQTIESSDQILHSPDGAPPKGTCTLGGYFTAVYNGHVVKIPTCQ